MRIGFLNNQIDNRGTGNALYDYAHYNEAILGNESIILTKTFDNYDKGMAFKLAERFGFIHSVWDYIRGGIDFDVLYHIKYGNDDDLRIPDIRYGVHAVFDGSQPHGDRYATISQWMGAKYNIPYVPHIVDLAQPDQDLRKKYNIPADARVFGRHGGTDTFDIPWVWDAINEAMKADDSIHMLFMNTAIPDVELYDPSRFTFIGNSANPEFKSSFIYACNAMLHARARGETFGIAVGEFAIANKPVLTYGGSPERAHIDQLGHLAYLYNDKDELVKQLLTVNRPYYHARTKYLDHHPYAVMQKFNEVFLK